MDRPALEIVTRHLPSPRRELLLREQQDSLRPLRGNWVQTILVDNRNAGIGASHERLQTFEPYGERLWLLDDDDLCIEPMLLSLIDPKADMQIFRMFWLGIVLPRENNWEGRRLSQGDCGTSTAIITRAVWLEARHRFTNRYEGDYDFLRAAYDRASNITWTDHVIANIRAANRGQP